MAASRRNRRSRPAPPMATGPERLECRAMLTASAADAVIEVTATAADPAPWLTYAQQSPLGSLVLRVVLSPGNSPTAEPATTMQVLQATFNTSKSVGGQPPIQIGGVTNTIPGSSGPDQPIADPQFTGVVFPGQGVPVLPTDTWPKPIDALEGTPPTTSDGPQEYFVVLESDSDVVLSMTSLIIVASSDPTLGQAGATPGETSSSDASDPTAVGGLFGALGGQGSPSAGGDPTAGLATLLAFAALAGLAMPTAGPNVTLANDTGASDGDGITSDGRLDVTAAPGDKIQYSVDHGKTWKTSFKPVPGKNSVDVRTVDASGTASPATTFAFTLDRRAPATPRLALTIDSGRSASDSVTNVADPTVGRREADATLEYSVNGGRWTTEYAPLEGRNVVRVRQIDLAGNVSRPSNPLTFRLDTQSAALVVASRLVSPRPGGSLPFVGMERGAVVQYSIDGGTSWSQRRPAAAFRGMALVRQVDLAGNQSAATLITS